MEHFVDVILGLVVIVGVVRVVEVVAVLVDALNALGAVGVPAHQVVQAIAPGDPIEFAAVRF